jgi:hypothetical protein
MKDIPKIINYIFGLNEKFCKKPFSFFHYLNILSSHIQNPSYDINVHYLYKPDSIYFDKLSEFCNFNILDMDIFSSYKNNIKFKFEIHLGDLFRINYLYEHGGIYLDIDTVCLHPFEELLKYDCVMGEEWGDNEYIGLCNAVILSNPKNLFIKEWINNYYTDYKSNWNYNSVVLPDKISKYMSDHITIEPQQSFFRYSWDKSGVENIFDKNSSIDGCYCLHLWESITYKRLIKYDIDYIKNNNDTLSNIYKKLL